MKALREPKKNKRYDYEMLNIQEEEMTELCDRILGGPPKRPRQGDPELPVRQFIAGCHFLNGSLLVTTIN